MAVYSFQLFKCLILCLVVLQGLLGWSYYLIMLPFRFTYYTILDIFR